MAWWLTAMSIWTPERMVRMPSVIWAVTGTVALLVGLQTVLAYFTMHVQEDELTDDMLHREVQHLIGLAQRDTRNKSSEFATNTLRNLGQVTDLLARSPHRSASLAVLVAPAVSVTRSLMVRVPLLP